MNLENLVAIDVHTHAWKSALRVDDTLTESQEAMGRYFRYQPQHQTVPEMAEYYRKLKMAFVVFTVDDSRENRKISNEEIAELARQHTYPLYEVIAEAKLPALFHSGQTGVGAGTRGGGGIRLKYSHPMLLDDVAVDFPDMPIVIAHLSGSDYPVLSPEKWMEEFAKLPIKPEVKQKIFKENAARLLRL
jgi:hypothetical protein